MSIEYVAGQIIELTDEDFAKTELDCLNQINYDHPFNRKTTADTRKLGQHNMKSLKMLKELQLQLTAAEPMEVDLPHD